METYHRTSKTTMHDGTPSHRVGLPKNETTKHSGLAMGSFGEKQMFRSWIQQGPELKPATASNWTYRHPSLVKP